MIKRPSHPYPRVGVCALVQKGDLLLFGLRRGSHGANTWAPPGGKLELGEGWEACARREALEEAGIRIKHIRFLTATNDLFPSDGLHYITLILQCEWASGTPRVMEPNKCFEWKWFPYSKLPQPLFEPMKGLKKQYPSTLPSLAKAS